jgi:hypothetical protein
MLGRSISCGRAHAVGVVDQCRVALPDHVVLVQLLDRVEVGRRIVDGSVDGDVRTVLSDVLEPDIAAEPGCGFAFHLHAVIGMRFFALWPFTRRVDAISAPLNYLFRPYIVYRPRDAHLGS